MRRLIGHWAPVMLCIAALATNTLAQNAERERYLFMDELKLPAKAVMRTVVQGTKIDELTVEVLSILRNFGPKRDVILGRITDKRALKAGIVGGMSGSPIYINGKIIGALAYGWGFQKDAYIGIQPIEQMLRLRGAPKARRRGRPRGGRLPLHDGEELFCRALYRLDSPKPTGRKAAPETAGAPQLRALANPLTVSGVNERTFALVRKLFAGTNFVPLAGGGAPAEAMARPVKLVPGAAVAVVLASGDVDVSMVGTCTDVVGNRVLAFGHDIFGEGKVDLPMAGGYIHATIPSVMRSFKLGSPTKIVGRFHQDEQAGVLGDLATKARRVPVRIVVTDGAGEKQTFNFQIVHSIRFTRRMLRTVISAAISGQAELPRLSIMRYTGEAFFQGFRSLTYKNSVIADEWDLMRDLIGPIDLMMDNRFGEATFKELRLEITVVDEPLAAKIINVRTPNKRFRPGETVTAAVVLRPYRKDDIVETIRLRLPTDLPDGSYRCMVGDAGEEMELLTDLEPHRFKPRDLAGVLKALRIGAKRERLYMRLVLPSGGLAVEGIPLADLPPSRARLLTGSGLTKIQRYRRSIGTSKPMPFLVRGGRGFEIVVDKNAPR